MNLTPAPRSIPRPARIIGPVVTVVVVLFLLKTCAGGGKAEATVATSAAPYRGVPCDAPSEYTVGQWCGWWREPGPDHLWDTVKGPLRDAPRMADVMPRPVFEADQVHEPAGSVSIGDVLGALLWVIVIAVVAFALSLLVRRRRVVVT